MNKLLTTLLVISVLFSIAITIHKDTKNIQLIDEITKLEQELNTLEKIHTAALAELSGKIAWNSYRNYSYLVSGTLDTQIIRHTLLHNELGYILRLSIDDYSYLLYVWPEYAPDSEVQKLILASENSIRAALNHITVPKNFIEFQNDTRPLTRRIARNQRDIRTDTIESTR